MKSFQFFSRRRPESRHNAKLDEIFALVFLVRTKLLAQKQDEFMKNKFKPGEVHSVPPKISSNSISNDVERRAAEEWEDDSATRNILPSYSLPSNSPRVTSMFEVQDLRRDSIPPASAPFVAASDLQAADYTGGESDDQMGCYGTARPGARARMCSRSSRGTSREGRGRFRNGGSSSNRTSSYGSRAPYGIIDLTRDTDTEDDGYILLNDPPSPLTPIEATAFMSSRSQQNVLIDVVENSQQLPQQRPQAQATAEGQDTRADPSYEQQCHSVINKCMLLIFGIKAAAQKCVDDQTTVESDKEFIASDDSLLFDYEDEELPSAKSSETFRTPHNWSASARNGSQKKEAVLVRRLGRNVLRFTAQSLISHKREWFSDALATESWNSEPSIVIRALQRQEERAHMRLNAIGTIFELVSKSDESSSTGSNEVDADFLSSVIEFLLAGCFQLGLVPALNAANQGEQYLRGSDPSLPLSHYLDGIQAAPIAMKQQVVQIVHQVMHWIISNLQAQILAAEEGAGVTFKNQNDDVKLLHLFSLSGRFSASDVKVIVNAGLLPVLEKFCQVGSEASNCLGKISSEVWGSLPYPHYVTVASVRLLHMIAVSCA